MSLAVGRSVTDLRAWLPAVLAFGAGLALLGVLFAEEVIAAVRIWESSTAYNHCWLVLPIAIWLGWTRRSRLTNLSPRPMPVAALLMVGVGVAWLLAERLGIMEGRQFAVVGSVWVLALAVFGWRICRAMAGPLAYLIFLVPFAEFMTPVLQDATLVFIEVGLRLLDIPHYVDGLVIVDANELRVGEFANVRITDADTYDLFAQG